MGLRELKEELEALADPAQAAILMRFFKTGPGQYGEGDRFLGLKVPLQRQVAARHRDLPHRDILALLASPWHEHRLTALLIWVGRYETGRDDRGRAEIYDAYLAHTACVNNWDLVDLSAPNIVGAHLLRRDRTILQRLAGSASLWERRIAIVATFAFIRQGESRETFAIAETLLADPHDLIHKAAGWMLREVGKRVSAAELTAFLEGRRRRMPRTMLRYAIERFPPEERARLLAR